MFVDDILIIIRCHGEKLTSKIYAVYPSKQKQNKISKGMFSPKQVIFKTINFLISFKKNPILFAGYKSYITW